ncbi:NAD(P)H-quinone oxidoreductase subunit I, chloroplastic [Peptococcaceae bacterium CEB3]|nr:NAD(P)H-quinone oxidoreductase subunit I, chloroplastic [Peptococcaceae bacterium CEB3]
MVRVTENTQVIVNHDWCKKCGVCIAFCPKKVLESDELGRVVVARPEECIACRICERLCPDFAINIEVSKDE